MFDFSEYPDNSKFCYEKQEYIGKIKDETKDVAIAEFVGLKCKTCSYKKYIIRETKREKALLQMLFKKITHGEHWNFFFEKKQMGYQNKRIQSKSQQLEKYEVSKVF